MLGVTVAGELIRGSTVAFGGVCGVLYAGEALLGGWLVVRSGGDGDRVMPARWVLSSLVPSCLLAAAVCATLGDLMLTALESRPSGPVGFGWDWFAADALGMLMVVPAVRALFGGVPGWVFNWRRVVEACGLLIATVVVVRVVFTDAAGGPQPWQWPYLLLPCVFWAAVRFGPQSTAVVTAVLDGVVVAGTAAGGGPFAQAHTVEAQIISAQLLRHPVPVHADDGYSDRLAPGVGD